MEFVKHGYISFGYIEHSMALTCCRYNEVRLYHIQIRQENRVLNSVTIYVCSLLCKRCDVSMMNPAVP